MRFIDSFNFLPMGLAKLPKTFGKTESAKGYFPHLFNIEENQSYVGELSDPVFYSPDSMSIADRSKFYYCYCIADVSILRECCLDFQKEFLDTAAVNPFRYVTIASACMATYRAHHIPETKIAMMPQHGYVNNCNNSADSIRWLDNVAHCDGISIRLARNGTGEVKIDGVSIDGFCEAPNTVYQAVFWHGCMICFNPDTENPVSQVSMRTLANKTQEINRLREKGYTVTVKWEHDFRKDLNDNQELQDFVKNHESVDRYPVGHPEVLTENFSDVSSYFGIIKCKVLPPRGLYHPIYEVYHFKESSTDLFRSYIDLFLKIKQEASGWPANCITEEDKAAYITAYQENEGIQLNPEHIAPNPGRRTVGKLCLNSFWGRWGMNLDKMQLDYVTSLEKFNALRTDVTKCVTDVYLPTEEVCVVHWRHEKGFSGQDKHTNVFLAAFTTCHARLKLYDELDKLKQHVLYFDTDSIIYKSDGKNDPPLGNYLGDFTDEGGPKNYGYITNKGKTVCKNRGFKLNYRNSLIFNFDMMKRLVREFDQDTTMDLVNPSKICRDPKRRIVYNREEVKKYRIVYTKRIIQDDYSTIPFGY
ncbi:hypothetical protein JTE90_003453 [Oedothorax gibbosus]|uniref:DNA-directed DNA polymerase n=1 Tax=Oedothorax gibbosus TaxID=931172 RepID=A0AAV6TZX0_9ARAC|nr:hypothetical protein JTE90_003453 [Oedothorax gibbosus]